MTIEQINALTILDVQAELIARLYPEGWIDPEAVVEEGEEPVVLAHPPLDTIQDALAAELVTYKAELVAIEEERLRKQDLLDRFDVFTDIGLLQGALNMSNPAAYFRDEILNNSNHAQAETNLVAMESAYTSALAAQSAALAQETLLNTRKAKRLHGEYVLDMFSASLEAAEVSNANSKTILNTYSEIISLLKVGSLEIAREEALLLTPTALVSADMITQFVALIDQYEA